MNLGVQVSAAEPVGAVDFTYLEGFMAGDKTIVKEVLELFLQQAQVWVVKLDPPVSDWRDVVHGIKGSARGVGANALGDASEEAERLGEEAIPAVCRALAASVADIRVYLSGLA